MSMVDTCDANPDVTKKTSSIARELAAGVSIELNVGTPPGAPIPNLDGLRPGMSVYLPFLSGNRFINNLDACRQLAEAGLDPIPHLAARRIGSHDELDEALAAYRSAGASAFLLIAGDEPNPAGPFTSTLDLIGSGLIEKHGIKRLGVAGHPDGLAHAGDAELMTALRTKAGFAAATGIDMWVVTQFLFAADSLIDWDRALAGAGVTLPVHAGLPGPARLSTLISFALKCGVGTSARMLARRPDAMRLAARWSPGPLLDQIAAHLAETPESRIKAVHIFPFGGMKASRTWLDERAGTES